MLFELAESISLSLALALIYRLIIERWSDGQLLKGIVLGTLFGTITMIGMHNPIEVQEGVIIDARTVIISIAAVFGGPVVGVITAGFGAAYRLNIGGDGMIVGLSMIVVALFVGIIYRHQLKQGKVVINVKSLLIMASITQLLVLVLFFMLPSGVLNQMIHQVALPMFIFYIVGTVALGKLLHLFERELTVRKQLTESNASRAKALEDIIHVMSATLEKRDPYTAGHEKNVANLSRLIGQKLGYEGQKLEGLTLAASIHDIGKIQIPSEILSKPSKLSNIEYELIKEHPKSGADLLTNVKLDWPIANIILQHHERMDGTGYPSGLRGEEIMEEARIIAVADTLDAMANHRPYRAALGKEAALEEILQGSGKRYDKRVAEACISLIKEGVITFD